MSDFNVPGSRPKQTRTKFGNRPYYIGNDTCIDNDSDNDNNNINNYNDNNNDYNNDDNHNSNNSNNNDSFHRRRAPASSAPSSRLRRGWTRCSPASRSPCPPASRRRWTRCSPASRRRWTRCSPPARSPFRRRRPSKREALEGGGPRRRPSRPSKEEALEGGGPRGSGPSKPLRTEGPRSPRGRRRS